MAEELIIERIENTVEVINLNNTRIVEIALGLPGKGIPGMGSEGQYLKKNSNIDFDTAWSNISSSEVYMTNIRGINSTNVQTSIEEIAFNAIKGNAPIKIDGSGNNTGTNTVSLDMNSVEAETILNLTDKLLIQRDNIIKSVTYDQISDKGDSYLRGSVNLVASGNSGTVTGDPLNATLVEGTPPSVNAGEPTTGVHYIVENATVVSSITGESLSYTQGDYVEWSGTGWIRIIRTLDEYVQTFNGRDRNVTPQAGDYSADQVTNAADKTADNTFDENVTIAKVLTVVSELVLTGTLGMKLASGTSLERPSLPTQGYFRFNTDSDTLEVYDGTKWVSIDPDLLQANIDQVASDLSDVEARVSANETAISNNASDISDLATAIGGLPGDISGLRADVDANTAAISAVDTKANDNTSTIAALDTRIDGVDLTVAAVDAKTVTNAANILTNENDIAVLQLPLDDLVDRVDALDTIQFNWEPTRTYQVNNGVYFNEKIYKCLITNTGNQPDTSPTQWEEIALGRDLEWSNTFTYTTGQVAWYTDSWYICLQESTGDQPDTSPLFWEQQVTAPGVTWNTDATYNIGDLVWYNEFFWESLTDDNKGNTPAEDANWTNKGGLGGDGGITAFYGDRMPISQIVSFPNYKDRLGDGFLPIQYGGAVSQTGAYADLYSEVGDIYEQMHVDAGYPASGAGMFYPTPTPDAYPRSGLPVLDFTDSNVDATNNRINTLPSWVTQNRRSGTLMRFEVVSGSAPGGLVNGELYYIEFTSTQGTIGVYTTEAGAISGSGRIDITSTGSGTFRLTQEGIAIEDALEEHEHDVPFSTASTTASGGVTRALAGSTQSGGVENAKVSNETRPKTFYLFYYIKAFNVNEDPVVFTPDTDWHIGAKVEYLGNAPIPTGLVELQDTNILVNIADYPKGFDLYGTKYGGDGITTYGLPTILQAGFDTYWKKVYDDPSNTSNVSFSEMITSGVGDYSFEYDVAVVAGAPIFSSPLKITDISIGALSPVVEDSGSGLRMNTRFYPDVDPYFVCQYAGYFIKKIWKLEMPENVTPCVYLGNGSATSARDAGVDARLTRLENELLLSSETLKYDWTNHDNAFTSMNLKIFTLPDGDDLTDYIVTGFYKSTLNGDIKSLDLKDMMNDGLPTGDWISTVHQPNGAQDVFFVTGGGGFIVESSNNATGINNNDLGYLKFVAYKPNAVSFINAQNAFINKKDWVRIHEDLGSTALPTNIYLESGKYRMIIGRASSDFYTIEMTIDRSLNGGNCTFTAPFSSGNYLNYQVNTNSFTSDLSGYGVHVIERFQDTTGADKPSVPLKDGYETLYENWASTNENLQYPVASGVYQVLVSDGGRVYTANIEVALESEESIFNGSYGTGGDVEYNHGTGFWSTGIGTDDIVALRKATDRLTLDINHTRAKTIGSPEIYQYNFTATQAEDDISGSLPVHAQLVNGDKMRISNEAPEGSGFNLTGLPLGHVLPPQKSIEYTYAYHESKWNIDNSALANFAINQKDWVEKWTASGNVDRVASTLVEDFGPGRWTIHGVATFASLERDFTTELIIKDVTKLTYSSDFAGTAVTTDLIYFYYDATLDGGSFRASRNGSWTNGYITRIEKWQDTTGADKPSVPLDDGWELVYEDLDSTGLSTVPNSWGLGSFGVEIEFQDGNNDRFFGTSILSESGGSKVITTVFNDGAGNRVNLDIDISNIIVNGAGAYTTPEITRIYKFKGALTLDIYHTNAHVSGVPNSDYESLTTTSGDIDGGALLPSSPNTGDKITFFNAGTAGNHITNLPGSIELGDGCEITFTWNGTENRWTYDRGTLIEHYTDTIGGLKHNVSKFAGGTLDIQCQYTANVNVNAGGQDVFFPLTETTWSWDTDAVVSGSLLPISSWAGVAEGGSFMTGATDARMRVQTTSTQDFARLGLKINGFWKDPTGV